MEYIIQRKQAPIAKMICLMSINEVDRKDVLNDSGGGSVGGPKIQNEKAESDAKKKRKQWYLNESHLNTYSMRKYLETEF